MKGNLLHSLLCLAGIFAGVDTSAQTGDNFNSRPSVPLSQVKSYLQDHCSQFVGFNVNANNWNPQIEGDGAMVSENVPSPSYGISPALNIDGSITISFKYKFNNHIRDTERRWLKIYLADVNSMPLLLLDSMEFHSINTSTVYNFNKTLSTPTGAYKIYVSYNGIGGSAAIAVDELWLSASKVYETGCNTAPTAANDNLTGLSNRSATGTVLNNDSDADNEALSIYLISGSPDGNVVLNTDGSFSFTPNPGFNGSSTSFTYKVCDQGLGVLCSDDATATINFPAPGSGILPVSLTDFNGFYRNEGRVELNWVTNFEQNSDRFEIERSLDGMAWEKVGVLKAQGTSASRKSYTFTDEAGRNKAIKKDLYYRLKQIDLDNKSAYTRILIVRVYNTQSTKMISVTPSPSKNDIAVNVQLNESAIIAMKVINTNGADVMRKSVKANAGSNSYILEGTSKLQPGMYVLEVIINSKERMVVKLIKE